MCTDYFSLHIKFENLFKHPIHLITENSLSNPFFIQGIEKTKTLIMQIKSFAKAKRAG
jgi:hypothetical protein